MVSFKINLEVMSSVGTQKNETFRGSYEMQRRATTLVITNGSKIISRFDNVGNVTSVS